MRRKALTRPLKRENSAEMWNQSKTIEDIATNLYSIDIGQIFDLSKTVFYTIVCKLEFVGILTFLRSLQSENALPRIFVKLGGIEISSIADSENALLSIVCKLEFVGISTFQKIKKKKKNIFW